jgi:hypothetical protein
MNRLASIVLFILLAINAGSGETGKPLLKIGRTIDLDGVLREWNLADAHRMSPQYDIFWDAINTPAGVSGYFRYARPDSFMCAAWAFRIYPQSGDTLNFYAIVGDKEPTSEEKLIWRRSRNFVDGLPYITIEWTLPWSNIKISQDRKYKLKIRVLNICEESLAPIVLEGKRLRAKGSGRVMGPESLFLLVFSAVLFGLYLNMRSRFKRH